MRSIGRHIIAPCLAATMFIVGSCSWVMQTWVYDRYDQQEGTLVDCRYGPATADTVFGGAELIASVAVISAGAAAATRVCEGGDCRNELPLYVPIAVVPLLVVFAIHTGAAITGWVKYGNCNRDLTELERGTAPVQKPLENAPAPTSDQVSPTPAPAE
jgi:hypothetical protein